MTGLEPGIGTAENYRRFARQEAAGRSPAYQRLAESVATDPEVLGFMATLSPAKRQPNLLFAASRWLLSRPPDPHSLSALVRNRSADLRSLMASRSTQTNEAGRCATILPALCGLPEPLALVEVGAAAGLTLLPDAYSYDYEGHIVRGMDAAAPRLRCRARGPVPLPTRVPRVVWRAGIDLNPLDVGDADDLAWLRCLLWPGEEGREQRLLAAAATARRLRPKVHRGDLLSDLAPLAAQAPSGATLVVYHSAVLAYVDEGKRRDFARLVRELGAVWLANEAPGVVPGAPGPPESAAHFLLVEGGRRLLAVADPHGSWLRWIG